MKRQPLVSVIVVNWNGGEVFRDCLVSLAKLTYKNWELIVVDNGSTDGSLLEIRKLQIPNVKLHIMRNKKNLGFAPANNQGVKVAKGKYVLLLNNDTKVTPDLLDVLVGKMEIEKDLGVVQPKIFLMDKEGYLDNAGSYLTRTGLLQHWGYMAKDGKEYSQEREIFSAKGACMLIRRTVIDEVGLFDADFGSYFEETDFCWRVWLSGARVVYYPAAHIYHKVGFTSRKMDQVRVTLVSTRNRISSLFKNLGDINLMLIFLPHVVFILVLGFYYLIRFQFKKAWMMWGAVLWNMVYLQKLIVKRLRVQRMRLKRDDEIFEKTMRPVDLGEMFGHFRKVEAN